MCNTRPSSRYEMISTPACAWSALPTASPGPNKQGPICSASTNGSYASCSPFQLDDHHTCPVPPHCPVPPCPVPPHCPVPPWPVPPHCPGIEGREVAAGSVPEHAESCAGSKGISLLCTRGAIASGECCTSSTTEGRRNADGSALVEAQGDGDNERTRAADGELDMLQLDNKLAITRQKRVEHWNDTRRGRV